MSSRTRRTMFAAWAFFPLTLLSSITVHVSAAQVPDQLWIRQIGTSSFDIAKALVPDGAGGVMVAGQTGGSLGGPRAGGIDAFLARYDNVGNQLWIRQFGTSDFDIAIALAPDGAGGVIVAGVTSDSLGGPNAGEEDVFLARYDGEGEQIWMRQFGSSEVDLAAALAPDGSGGVMIAGNTRGILVEPNAGIWDSFLARYDGKGNRLWIRQFGTSGLTFASALALDGEGGVIVAGETIGNLGGPSAGEEDAFLARYDGEGKRLWIRQFGTCGIEKVKGLVPDGVGGAIVSGYTVSGNRKGSPIGAQADQGINHTFLARYDGAGKRLWIREFGSRGTNLAMPLAPNGEGGVIYAGQGIGNVGGPISGEVDSFLASYDGEGNRLWFRQFGRSAFDKVRAIAPDGANGVIVAGSTEGNMGGKNAGYTDAFVARIGNEPTQDPPNR